MSVIAFHEKAGRSQVGSVAFFWNTFFSLAEWPLSPCFHPHSRGAIRSLGARWIESWAIPPAQECTRLSRASFQPIDALPATKVCLLLPSHLITILYHPDRNVPFDREPNLAQNLHLRMTGVQFSVER
jgi:hypothetical protein